MLGPGYRSPSRPIPNDLIPEIPSERHTGVLDDALAENKFELADNDPEFMVQNGQESMIDEDSDDSWWFEAVKAADNIENVGNLLLSAMVSLFVSLCHLVAFCNLPLCN